MTTESRLSPIIPDWPARLLAALLTAALVARWLIPTESAALGDTLWLTQGTLLLGLLWAFVALWQNPLPMRWRLSDAAVTLLVAGHVVSTLLVVAQSGDKRAAVNLLWEWLSLGALWFLLRHIVASRGQRDGLAVTLLATATMLAAFGIWQHYVWYPDHVKLYGSPRKELDDLLRTPEPRLPRVQLDIQRVEQRLIGLGVPAECLERPGRTSFESRLLHSREPLAAFALTNSLAGLLLPNLIIGMGAVVAVWQFGTQRRWAIPGVLVCGLVAYCLMLTKSRTAYVGLLAGLIVWGASRMRPRNNAPGDPASHARSRRAWWLAVGSAIVVGFILVVIALQTGGLDSLVLAQAPKSLKYRFEYWAGTWDVLQARPQNWLAGVGPGNFRQNYLQFKRPESSEEIADPHQFLLDVWANGGLIGLGGVLLLCWVSVRLLTARSTNVVQQSSDSMRRNGRLSETPMMIGHACFLGGLVAVASVLWLTAPKEAVAIGLVAIWLVSCGVWSAVARSAPISMQATAAIGTALASLAVHLLGAGGIGMPAITQTWFVWLAVGEANAESSAEANPQLAVQPLQSRGRTWAMVVLLAGVNLTCLFSATRPVRDRLAWEESAMTALSNTDNVGLAETRLRNAAAADPWSPEPWHRLADLTFRRWNSQSDASDLWARAIEYHQEAIRRDPRQPGAHRTLGRWYLRRFEKTRDPQDGSAAERALATAAELYPNHAGIQADLAEAATAAGDRDAAQNAIHRALELDMINLTAGHTDKLLETDQRLRLQRMQIMPTIKSLN